MGSHKHMQLVSGMFFDLAVGRSMHAVRSKTKNQEMESWSEITPVPYGLG